MSSEQPGAVGIDLGTTNSVVARVDSFGLPVVVPNVSGEAVTPSVLYLSPGGVVAGEEAREYLRSGDSGAVAHFKREMGNANFAFSSGSRPYSAQDLSALLLTSLKAQAEAWLGHTIKPAVITVPAYFRNPEREATIAAGRAAGFDVLQVINEPTAAAIAHGFAGQSGERTVLVYDLGGGTFDVTLLRVEPDGSRVLVSDGDHKLGGKDWDSRIADFLAREFEQEFGSDPQDDIECSMELLGLAEDAKRRLSGVERVESTIRAEGDRGRYELRRDAFEDLTADLVERTLSLCRGALEAASLNPDQVDELLLVGGSTRMPMIQRALDREFAWKPVSGVNVDEAVALGAALRAAELCPASARPSAAKWALPAHVKTVDVTNHSLGMIAVNTDGSAFTNSIILRKNVPVPSCDSRPYQHSTWGRPSDIEVFVTQGELEAVDKVTYLGKYVVEDVPPGDGGQQVVEIEYRYDLSGVVDVRARVRDSGDALSVRVEALPSDVPARFLGAPADAAGGHSEIHLAIDVSGSMYGGPMRLAQEAALTFARNLDLSHASISIMAFADSSELLLDRSQDASAIEDAVGRVSTAEVGGGNRANPFDDLHERTREAAQGPSFSVVLTDGLWSCSDRAIAKARACREAGMEIVAVGFGSADRNFLKAIASMDEAAMMVGLSDLVSTFGSVAQVITGAGSAISPGRGDSTESRLRQRLAGAFKQGDG